jgi:signal transduction histidine kinase
MAINHLENLAALIKQERNALLARWRQEVRGLPSAKHLDNPTLNDHIPEVLEELTIAFQAGVHTSIPEALHQGPPAHGLQRFEDGFDIEEVVAEYDILRGCIHDLADSHGLSLQGAPFHILNRVLDRAIGLAVQTYATQRTLEVRRRLEEHLAFVAHDLRTPLNAISLATRVLELGLRDHSPSTDTARMLKTLRRNVQHLEDLVGKVLEEHIDLETETGIKLQRRTLDLWPLVEALIHDLHPIAGTASTQLLNKVPDELVVYADASLLKRVLQNLIANAIAYTPRGEVTIGARRLDDGDAVECWVSDNGAGISAECLQRVFDKSETNSSEGDVGLGLAIVKTFVKAHGGQVMVESKEGVGSTFRFTLPSR